MHLCLPLHSSDVKQQWSCVGALQDEASLASKPAPPAAAAVAAPAPFSATAGGDAQEDDGAPMIAASIGSGSGSALTKHGKATTLQRVAHYFRKRLI